MVPISFSPQVPDDVETIAAKLPSVFHGSVSANTCVNDSGFKSHVGSVCFSAATKVVGSANVAGIDWSVRF